MIPKQKTVFVCQKCGSHHSKWLGQCATCKEWNSIKERIFVKSDAFEGGRIAGNSQVIPIQEVRAEVDQRLSTGDAEFDTVLGGGIVPGSVILLGGEPGIGKSTLSLQLGLRSPQYKTLYISGEESFSQIKLRADRLGIAETTQCFLVSQTHIQSILHTLKEAKPHLVIIDSIQTLYDADLEAASGSISQIRHCALALVRFAKEHGVPMVVIGHITKDGAIAGPKVLEHMVDVVLQFEGNTNYDFRLLRTTKNRYGSVAALGIFRMESQGLIPVSNPSQILMGSDHAIGSSVGSAMEGTRPLLVETQALVSHAVYGTPQRSTTGFDARRLNMILAVMEKKLQLKLGARDVFINIAGGFQIKDPGLDLAIAVSIFSSFKNVEVPQKVSFCGELGLSGEVRPVHRIDQRIMEAKKMGLTSVYISHFQNLGGKDFGIELVALKTIDELPAVFR